MALVGRDFPVLVFRQSDEAGEGIDWATAEALAFGTLAAEGFNVRLSGQDSGRGTFFHRHAVLHDQNREKFDEGTYVPLQNIGKDQGDFVVIDSASPSGMTLSFSGRRLAMSSARSD